MNDLGARLVLFVSTLIGIRRWAYRRYYLRSNHWRRRRIDALARADFTCSACGAKRDRNRWVALDVHHVTYKRLWRESARDLLVLCRSCHADIHRRES